MKDFPVTPKLLRTLAGQTGFEHFRLTENHIVTSVVRGRQRGTVMTQPVGRITNVQGFLDWCQANDVEVEDWRPDAPSELEPAPPSQPLKIPPPSPPKHSFVAVINMRTDDPGHVYPSRGDAEPHIRGVDGVKHAEFELACQAESWLDHQRRERGMYFQLLAAASNWSVSTVGNADTAV